MVDDFWQLEIMLNLQHVEAVEQLLWSAGAVSVTFLDAEDNPIFEPDLGTTPLWVNTKIVALFDNEDSHRADVIKTAVIKITAEDNLQIHYRKLPKQNWERAWLAEFKPMQFGQNLWIVPSAYRPPNPDAVNLLLDPGLAFGTGTHPSTFLCLTWLDANAELVRGKNIIDYGCGSGVLAIASLLLGAKSAVGIDIDEQALQASRSNAQRNNLSADKLALFLVDGHNPDNLIIYDNKDQQTSKHQAAQKLEKADIVLANILANPLICLRNNIARLAKSGAQIVLAGILLEQASKVIAAYQQFASDEIVLLQQDEWACLSFTTK